ncbi:MAG: hypothetical protein ACREDD_06470 [Methylocella sp.]
MARGGIFSDFGGDDFMVIKPKQGVDPALVKPAPVPNPNSAPVNSAGWNTGWPSRWGAKINSG